MNQIINHILDLEAEQAVLGSIIYYNDKLTEVGVLLSPLDFFSQPHQLIFEAMLELDSKNVAIDEVLIGDVLRTSENLELVGGYAYLAELVDCVPASGNAVHYSKIVKKKAQLRKMKKGLELLAKQAANSDASPEDIISQVMQFAEVKGSHDSGTVTMHDLMPDIFEELEKASSGEKAPGVTTGFIDLDHLSGRLQNGDYIVIAARPSMGKTALVTGMIKSAIMEQLALEKKDKESSEKQIVFFTAEMKENKIVKRILSGDAGISVGKFRTGNLEPEEWDKLALSIDSLSEMSKRISLNHSIKDVDQLCMEARRQHRIKPVMMVVVDYLQILSVNPKLAAKMNTTDQVGYISRKLKWLAGELNVPVVVLSQLNRELEKRNDKRPQLSDLRSSGDIEQDADLVLFIYRDEVYNEDTPDKGIAEIIQAKGRDSGLGTVNLCFVGKTTTFSNLSKQDYYN